MPTLQIQPATFENILVFDRNAVAAQSTFWDFGHFVVATIRMAAIADFWRPASIHQDRETNLTVAALLIAVSVISGIVTVLLFRSLAASFLTEWAATFVAIAFSLLLCFPQLRHSNRCLICNRPHVAYVIAGQPFADGNECRRLALRYGGAAS